jgi:preprotein translocase subunit SecB
MGKDKQPGIDFYKIIIERISFERNPDFSFPEEGLKVDIKINTNSNIDKSKKILKLSLDLYLFSETEKSPFKLSILISGYFKAKYLEKLEEFSKVQGPALLFPFAREIIADLTMRSGFPPLIIPPVNILALVGKSPKK